MILDLKGLNKPCECGSNTVAGNCCRKDETCPCGSLKAFKDCCIREADKIKAAKADKKPAKGAK